MIVEIWKEKEKKEVFKISNLKLAYPKTICSHCGKPLFKTGIGIKFFCKQCWEYDLKPLIPKIEIVNLNAFKDKKNKNNDWFYKLVAGK